MKDKLIKLINACIADDAMFTHQYIEREYIGINENIDEKRTSYIEKAELNGIDIKKSKDKYKYDFGLEKNETYGKFYEIVIGFGKEPQLVIKSMLKGNDKTQQKTLSKSIGYRQTYLFKIPKTFDVTIVTNEYQYELRCGAFAFKIDNDIVEDIFKRIKAKRKELADQKEMSVINERFVKYNID